jgi:quercetin dioxygenase-like cupin family protein
MVFRPVNAKNRLQSPSSRDPRLAGYLNGEICVMSEAKPDGRGLVADADGVKPMPFQIPGATGEFLIQILNQDQVIGVVTSIVHLPPGGRIPAHRHQAGSEMHYVLEGDLVDSGRSLGAGSFLTHPAGQVHGPHESRNGAKVLTVQQWQSTGGSFDFEPV